MKRLALLTILLIAVILTACGTAEEPAPASSSPEPTLVISGGDINKAYTRADLEAMPVTEAAFKDVTYKGVTISALLEDAGFDIASIKAIKGVATDGYTVNFDVAQLIAADKIIAYATASGDLTADDGSFRMVLPGEEGKLNMRMLAELQIIQ